MVWAKLPKREGKSGKPDAGAYQNGHPPTRRSSRDPALRSSSQRTSLSVQVARVVRRSLVLQLAAAGVGASEWAWAAEAETAAAKSQPGLVFWRLRRVPARIPKLSPSRALFLVARRAICPLERPAPPTCQTGMPATAVYAKMDEVKLLPQMIDGAGCPRALWVGALGTWS